MAPRDPDYEIALVVNGTAHRLKVRATSRLVDVLRSGLRLTGTKECCGTGSCGACTVLVDGVRVNSCLALAITLHGRAITTVEGLHSAGSLHPLQRAFIACDAFQCGYCTPGQLMSAVGFLSEGNATDPDTVRDGMSGNICRCGAYQNITAAIQSVGR